MQQGKDVIFLSRLLKQGYSYTIHVEVDGQEIIFEPDEERNFRAISENNNSTVSIDIIRSIGEALEKHLR
jgi:hypothetical protein